MEAGFSSYAVGWSAAPDTPVGLRLDAGAVVALAARLGYRRVQLADNTPLHTLPAAERIALRSRADAAGLQVEVGARGLTGAHLETYVALAREFASPFVRFVIDAKDHEPDAAEVARLLRSRVPLLADAGVVLAIENHDRFTAAELARILAEVDSPWVGVCLDTANSLGAGEDVRTVLAALAPHVVNVHLKDVRARRVPHLQGFTVEGTPLGEGQVPLAWVLEQVSARGRCRSVTLEHWVPPDATRAATIERELAWCERSTARFSRLLPGAFAASAS